MFNVVKCTYFYLRLKPIANRFDGVSLRKNLIVADCSLVSIAGY